MITAGQLHRILLCCLNFNTPNLYNLWSRLTPFIMPAGHPDSAFATQPEQLVARIQATTRASESLIQLEDLDRFIQKNLIISEVPSEKPNPTSKDKCAVRSATAVSSTVGRRCDAGKDEVLVNLTQSHCDRYIVSTSSAGAMHNQFIQFLERFYKQLAAELRCRAKI